MYLITIILPLMGSIISGFFGRKIGVSGSQLIANFFIMLTTILSVVIFFEVGFNNSPMHLELFKWIDSETLEVYWGFNFDSLTASMLIPVLVVSSLVHMYSVGYMSHDPHNQRFFSYLSLFTFMMIILVTADNYLLMFVGWEGVGICSYLLVSFWYTRIAANQSSISAFLTNRVGDCFLTIGIFIMIWCFGNVDYGTVFSLSPFVNENIITLLGACLLIGAMAKSSQIGLHVWLPQAMEGPTPVSALIHAATMVTAGVYLLMRSSPMIEYSTTILMLCVWIGAFTTVFSSLIGLFQQDIKKVVAYSTMSQLGLMVVAVGLSCYNIALFHLVNHAFYKALLFLGAGSVIHAMSDNQDFRKYGSLKSYLPLTYSSMLIASLSLVAFPFMTGFYSKDFILESAYSLFGYAGVAVYVISTIGAIFTTLYSLKVLYLTFLASPNAARIDYHYAKENDGMISTPLVVLSLFSIFFGFITKDLFVGLGSDFFADNALYVHPKHEITINTEFAVPSLIKLFPFVFTLVFTIYSLYISEFSPSSLINFKYTKFGYNVFSFFNQRFYIELFYNRYITDNILYLGSQTTKIIDKGTVEMAGPYGLQLILQFISKTISRLDTGIVTTYALYILLGLVFYILTSYIGCQFNVLIVILCLVLLSMFNSINAQTQQIAQPVQTLNINSFATQPLKNGIHFTNSRIFWNIVATLLVITNFTLVSKYLLSSLIMNNWPIICIVCLSLISVINAVLIYIISQSLWSNEIKKRNLFFMIGIAFVTSFFIYYINPMIYVYKYVGQIIDKDVLNIALVQVLSFISTWQYIKLAMPINGNISEKPPIIDDIRYASFSSNPLNPFPWIGSRTNHGYGREVRPLRPRSSSPNKFGTSIPRASSTSPNRFGPSTTNPSQGSSASVSQPSVSQNTAGQSSPTDLNRNESVYVTRTNLGPEFNGHVPLGCKGVMLSGTEVLWIQNLGPKELREFATCEKPLDFMKGYDVRWIQEVRDGVNIHTLGGNKPDAVYRFINKLQTFVCLDKVEEAKNARKGILKCFDTAKTYKRIFPDDFRYKIDNYTKTHIDNLKNGRTTDVD